MLAAELPIPLVKTSKPNRQQPIATGSVGYLARSGATPLARPRNRRLQPISFRSAMTAISSERVGTKCSAG